MGSVSSGPSFPPPLTPHHTREAPPHGHNAHTHARIPCRGERISLPVSQHTMTTVFQLNCSSSSLPRHVGWSAPTGVDSCAGASEKKVNMPQRRQKKRRNEKWYDNESSFGKADNFNLESCMYSIYVNGFLSHYIPYTFYTIYKEKKRTKIGKTLQLSVVWWNICVLVLSYIPIWRTPCIHVLLVGTRAAC